MSEVEIKRKPRALKGTDLYLLVGIIAKIGVRNIMHCTNTLEIQETLKENEGKETDEAAQDELMSKIGSLIFYGVADVILERMENCEGAICRLLSRLYDMPETEVKELGALEYLNMLLDVAKDERFVDFFKQAYESVKQMM